MVTSRTEVAFMTAEEMAAAMRSGEASSRELTRAVLDLIDSLDGSLVAFLTRLDDLAMAMAASADDAMARGENLGPLHGVPVGIKDMLHIEGVPNTQGSLIMKDTVAPRDSALVARLRRGGAVFAGTTNCSEFGIVAWSENKVVGTTCNPWDVSRTAGGSSGGSAAAVAAGILPLAAGTDGGGSIRIPASFCGAFGFKPTWNLVAKAGDRGGWSTIAHAGPITRTVADAALMLDVMAGYERGVAFSFEKPVASYRQEIDRPLEKLRVAWSPDLGFAAVDPEVARLSEAAARTFSDLGCEVEEATPDFVDLAGPAGPYARIAMPEANAALGPLLEDHRDEMMKYTARFLELSRDVTVVDYIGANYERVAMWEKLNEFFERYDLLLTPTLASVAFPHGQQPREIAGRSIPVFGWSPFCTPFNLTGAPAATVPVGLNSEGLPAGLQIIGPAFRDHVVLRAAAAFEQARPWAQLKPAIATGIGRS
ncbi:MAG: amidase [Dehalococcoidia bacterium]|nr:amidase [Dehalococcoidia bacterium]